MIFTYTFRAPTSILKYWRWNLDLVSNNKRERDGIYNTVIMFEWMVWGINERETVFSNWYRHSNMVYKNKYKNPVQNIQTIHNYWLLYCNNVKYTLHTQVHAHFLSIHLLQSFSLHFLEQSVARAGTEVWKGSASVILDATRLRSSGIRARMCDSKQIFPQGHLSQDLRYLTRVKGMSAAVACNLVEKRKPIAEWIAYTVYLSTSLKQWSE